MSPLKKSAFIAATIFLLLLIACGENTSPDSPWNIPGDNPSNPPNTPNPPINPPNPPGDDNNGGNIPEVRFLINDIVPSAALAGANVTIEYSGSDVTPDIIWSGMTITGTPVTGGTEKNSFSCAAAGWRERPTVSQKRRLGKQRRLVQPLRDFRHDA